VSQSKVKKKTFFFFVWQKQKNLNLKYWKHLHRNLFINLISLGLGVGSNLTPNILTLNQPMKVVDSSNLLFPQKKKSSNLLSKIYFIIMKTKYFSPSIILGVPSIRPKGSLNYVNIFEDR